MNVGRKVPQTRKCFAKDCDRTRGKHADPNLKLHSFPRTEHVCREWVLRAGNPRLFGMPISTLNERAYLCEHHFTPSQYKSYERRRLLPGALPTIFPTASSSAMDHSLLPTSFSTPVSSVSSTPLVISTVPSESLATPLLPSPLPSEIPSPEVTFRIHDLETNLTLDSSSNASLPGTSSALPATFPFKTSDAGDIKSSLKRKAARASLLKTLNVRKINDLTPKKKHLFISYKKKCRENSYLKRKCSMLVDPEKLFSGHSGILAKSLESRLDTGSVLLLNSQLRNSQLKPKGRRWTLKEKLFFLALYKRSPHTYLYLRTKFTLPSIKTLVSLLYYHPLKAGINPSIFNHLSSCVSQMTDCNKYCVLLFDEMSIRPSVVYNSRFDRLVGFEDHGSKGRSDAIAGEALVFMVRGLRRKWKQPVAFYFSHGSTPGLILADLIKEVLGALQNTGLKIVATVCDMGSNNTMALKHLGSTVRNPFFELNGQTIFTLHDPPHLLKCTRNMFLKHSIKGHVMVGGEMVTGIGRWSHLGVGVEWIQKSPNSRMYRTLTSSHLNPQWKEKMSVKLAVQVFNSSLGGVLDGLGTFGHMSHDVWVTSSFLGFVNQLFNSFNGKDGKGVDALNLCSTLTDHSSHLPFWNEAVVKINNWVFQKDILDVEGNPILDALGNPKIKGTVRPKCQNGWIVTIRAIKLLWEEQKKAGFISLEPQRLNQDPLENFFGSIRLHGGANHNPNMEQFTAAFKTSIINGISSQLLRGSNCESDDDVFLADLEEFLQLSHSFREDTEGGESATTDDLVCVRSFLHEDAEQLWTAESCTKEISDASVSCRILKALLQDNNCSTCLSLLTDNPSLVCEQLLSTGEPLHVEGRPYFPSERFVKSVGHALVCLDDLIPKIHLKERIGEVGKNVILESVFSWLTCSFHNIKERTAKEVCKYALYRYSISVSKRLSK